MVAEADARASAYKLRDTGLWSGRGLDVILDQLMELNSVFR
jgi:hypothetical protein